MSVVYLLLPAVLMSAVGAANILGVFPFPTESHHILGNSLLGNLAKRGHNVTYVSPFKIKGTIPNFTHLGIPELLQYKEGNI